MKRILLSLLFLLVFSGQALAYPLVFKSTIDPNGYAAPILIYSNEKVDVFIPDDMINFNLFYTKYPQNGNFNFSVYIEIKNEDLRQSLVNTLKERVDKGTVILLGNPNINTLQGSIQSVFFDMQNKQVITTKEIFVDRKGNFIGMRDDFKETIPLDGSRPLLSEIANNADLVLKKAAKDYQ
jgi:hypothetical protein